MKHYPFVIAGQEHGTKTEHIAMSAGGKYDKTHILMIGDAPGRYESPRAPMARTSSRSTPANEEESWKRFPR